MRLCTLGSRMWGLGKEFEGFFYNPATASDASFVLVERD